MTHLTEFLKETAADVRRIVTPVRIMARLAGNVEQLPPLAGPVLSLKSFFWSRLPGTSRR